MIPWYDFPVFIGLSISDFWIFVSPLIAGAVGAWLTRWFRRKDDRETRRTELVANKLQDAYFLICEAVEHPNMDTQEAFEKKLKLERALFAIELYADAETRQRAKDVANAFATGVGWVVYEPLLTALRDRFRDSIGLEKLNEPIKILKFVPVTGKRDVSPG